MGLNFFYTTILFFSCQCLAFAQIEKPENDPISYPVGGSLGLNDSLYFGLKGKGQSLAIWEAERNGYPHPNNPLIQGKYSIGDSQIGFSDHANSLAEFLFSKANAQGKQGIAPKSHGLYFNTQNFWEEFETNAANLNLSLHPYALNPGWKNSYPKEGELFWGGLEEVSMVEDYNFGYYSDETRRWDSVLFHNPFHFAIKSAGNSRNERGEGLHYFYRPINSSTSDYFLDSSFVKRENDGDDLGFDCLPPISVSKNLLVVGALKKEGQVQINEQKFLPQNDSPFGPSDDGRIKPDLMAFGEKTSQSAAFVAGATLLLHEQYFKVFDKIAAASMLKCILIHTADELGKYKGPDYKMGWGLINVNRAVKFISKDERNLIHGTISNGDSLRYFVHFIKGKSLKTTLVWNDPAGRPLGFRNDPIMLNNPNSMLVNDLDMKIMEVATGCVFRPFVLDPINPDLPAKNGNNSLDNVESIIWDLPLEGWYEIRINHKGNLKNGSQDFALALSNLEFGFAYDGKTWFPHKPSEGENNLPILILKDGNSLDKKEIGKFQNVSFE